MSWERYREELYAFVDRRVDGSDTEDIVHDVLLRALRNQHQLRDDSKIRSWLFQITRNAIVDYYRSRRPTEPIPEDLQVESPQLGDPVLEDLSRCIVAIADTLPEHYREALLLSELEGVKQREIAERAGISVSGAKSRVQRARQMLADELLACCEIELHRWGGVDHFRRPDDCVAC